MNKAILIATLLVLGAVAVAPTASAGGVMECSADLPQACSVVAGLVNNAYDYTECYLTTGPVYWPDVCA